MGNRRIGLVLGSGGARGSAHVGVLKVLAENDIHPDVIVGTSMGAQVGGLYAAGVSIEDLVKAWKTMTFGKVARTLLPTVPWSGWCSGGEVLRQLRRLVGDTLIEDLPIHFAAVATDLEIGLPWPITRGSLARAIRASLSVPGLFTPVWVDGRLLIDGGVSAPLPVDIVRDLGAEIAIAVDVLVCPEAVTLTGIPVPDYHERILGIMKRLSVDPEGEGEERRFYPSVFSVLFQMSTIFQKRMSEFSLRLHPPDVLIQPDFSPDPPCYSDVKRGIEAGEAAARRAMPEILEVLGGA